MDSSNQIAYNPITLVRGLLFLGLNYLLANMILVLGFSLIPGVHSENVFSSDPTIQPSLLELNVLRLAQGFNVFFIFGFTAWVISVMSGKSLKEEMGLKNIQIGQVVWIPVVMIAVLPFASFLHFDVQNFHLPEALHEWETSIKATEIHSALVIRRMLEDVSPVTMVFNFVVIAIIPAVCEELFFRGFLLRNLEKRYGLHVATWLSGLFFSILHFQFLGFFSRWALGVLLGYLYGYSRSIWASILGHFTHNFLMLIIVWMLLIKPQEGLDPFEPGPMGITWIAGIGSLIVTLGLMYFYAHKMQKQSNE